MIELHKNVSVYKHMTAKMYDSKVVDCRDVYMVFLEMLDKDHLKETITYKGNTMSRVSRRE